MVILKTIEVNQLCYVNQDNPTPCKDDFGVAINIVPINKENNFKNFVLGMETSVHCCEDFILGNTFKAHKKQDSIFIKTIKVRDDINYKFALSISEDFKELEYGYKYNECEVICAEIETKELGTQYAYVANSHNGYYSHEVTYSNEKNELETIYI